MEAHGSNTNALKELEIALLNTCKEFTSYFLFKRERRITIGNSFSEHNDYSCVCSVARYSFRSDSLSHVHNIMTFFKHTTAIKSFVTLWTCHYVF